MKNYAPSKNHTIHRGLTWVRAAVVAAAFAMPLLPRAHAESVAAPEVPSGIQAPAGHKAFLVGRAAGTQNYVCKHVGSEIKFALFTPEAVLSEGKQQLTSHYFSPNPFEANTEPKVLGDRMIRPTWRHSRDTSTVWAKAVPNASLAMPNTIPWLLLEVVGRQKGPNGGDTLTATTFIQRVNTTGGLAPSEGCTSPADIGNQAFVPYTADYVFFKKAAERDSAGGD